jgi:hypothetical protein
MRLKTASDRMKVSIDYFVLEGLVARFNLAQPLAAYHFPPVSQYVCQRLIQ